MINHFQLVVQAIMTLKGMRKADQQMILDTLGMDRVPSTTRGEAAGTSGAAAAAPATTTTTAATALPESGPLGSARLTANIPNFETNTRCVVPQYFHAQQCGCVSIEVAYSFNAIAWVVLCQLEVQCTCLFTLSPATMEEQYSLIAKRRVIYDTRSSGLDAFLDASQAIFVCYL